MSVDETSAAFEPTVSYQGDGWFETPLGEFRLHGDYEVVLVPRTTLEQLTVVDMRQALVAAKAAGDWMALEWFVTDEPEAWNYDDPGARDDFSLDLRQESEQVVIRIRTNRWVEADDPERDAIQALFAPFDARWGTQTELVDDEHDNMAVEIVLSDGVCASTAQIADEAVALLGALKGGGITLEVAAGLVRAGMPQLLLGQRECDWLDAKKQPYGLAQERHKLELAKDVAAFANGEGGLLLIGARTEAIRTGERLSEIKAIPLERIDLQQVRDVLDEWIYPVVDGLEIGAVATEMVRDAEKGVAYIYVPRQGEERRPFLVAGRESDGKVSSVFLSVPRRRDDDTIYSDVASIHGLLLAGRLAVAALGRPAK